MEEYQNKNIEYTLNMGKEFTFFNRNNQFNNNYAIKEHIAEDAQRKTIEYINSQIKKYGSFTYSVTSTKELTSNMLKQIKDLSKLKIQIFSGYADFKGNYKEKYKKDKYIDRMTYTGYEALNIISKIEQLESKINTSLPIRERTRQIYNLIASEYSYFYEYDNYKDGHKIAASLRGITSYNSTGKKGLVCAGYATLFKELCTRCGIVCDYITGYANERHAWNVVIDGTEIIPVDVTWRAGSGNDWFGASKEFQESHRAEENETFKNYYDKNYYRDLIISMNLYQNNNQEQNNNNNYDLIIEDILLTLDTKYGYGEGIKILNRYILEKNIALITRTDNARYKISNIPIDYLKQYISKQQSYSPFIFLITTLRNRYSQEQIMSILKEYASSNIIKDYNIADIIKSISKKDINTFINTKQSLDYIYRIMKNKYGSKGKTMFLSFLETGNTLNITRDLNARAIAQSLDKEFLKLYLLLNNLDIELSMSDEEDYHKIAQIKEKVSKKSNITYEELKVLIDNIGLTKEQYQMIKNELLNKGLLVDNKSSNKSHNK